MATIFTVVSSQGFIFCETEFQAALVILEQKRSQEISSKDENSPTKCETEKDIVLPNVAYNKIIFASSPHKSQSILERKERMDYVDGDSDGHWDVELTHHRPSLARYNNKTYSIQARLLNGSHHQ